MQVYLDNAASTPMLPEVVETMMECMKNCYGNPSAVHAHGRAARTYIEESRRKIADLIGCSPSEIIFTSGGTEADNFAINGCTAAYPIKQIITTPIEHHAVLYPVKNVAEKNSISVHYLTLDSKGRFDWGELEELLKQGPNYQTFVSLMHGNNEIGVVYDIEKIGNLCKEYQALFHSDTVQTIGHRAVNPQKTYLHYFTASAHKFYGPKGIGFLHCCSQHPLKPFIYGGGQERNQRAGTENVAAIAGMATALEWVISHHQQLHEHILGLKKYFKQRLIETIPTIDFNGDIDLENTLDTVLNVAFPGDDAESLILFNLDIHQISASGGSACTSGSVKPSHVLQAIGCSPERIANSVRFSFGWFNTTKEIDYVIQKLPFCL